MPTFMVFINIQLIFMTMTTGVYQIRNLINGKIYIGSTGWGFKKRWRVHRNQLRKNKHVNLHLQHAWNKYGETNFKFEIVETCSSSLCFVREQHYIDTLHPQYNILPNAGTARGYKHTVQAKALIGAASAGKNHPSYSGEHRFYHPEFGIFTGSIVDFGIKFKFRKSLPYKLTQGILCKTHGWVYIGKISDPLPESPETFYKKRIFNDKPSYCFQHKNGINFQGTIAEFIQVYNLDRSVIYKLAKGKRKYAYGWTIKT